MRLFELRCRARNLLLWLAFSGSFVATAAAAEFSAGGPLLDGLAHTVETNAIQRVQMETQRWRSPERFFVLRFSRITAHNVSWNGKREMDAKEIERHARTLGPAYVASAQPETGMNGAYGNFRVAMFEALNGSHCFAIRSFSGNNWPDTVDSFEGSQLPMGPDLLAGLYCRQGKPISTSEIQSLLDTIE